MSDEKSQTLANSVYVSHFPIPMTEDRLLKLFKPFGPVQEVVLKYSSIHNDWGPSHAFIHFEPIKHDENDSAKRSDDEDLALNPAVTSSIAALNGDGGNEAIQRMLDEEGKTDERWRSEKLEVKTRTIGGTKSQARRHNRASSRNRNDDKGPRARVFEAPEPSRLRRPPPPVVEDSMRDTRDVRHRSRSRSPRRDRHSSYAPRDRSGYDRDRYDDRSHSDRYDRYDDRDRHDRYDDRHRPERRRDLSPPSRTMRRPHVRDDRDDKTRC